VYGRLHKIILKTLEQVVNCRPGNEVGETEIIRTVAVLAAIKSPDTRDQTDQSESGSAGSVESVEDRFRLNQDSYLGRIHISHVRLETTYPL
jgi:hypothetical protein